MEISNKSPLPILAHWFLRQMPYMRKAYAIKEKFLEEEVDKTLHRLVDKSPGGRALNVDASCALDDILRREMILSENEGRPPLFHSRDMYDEILGFIIAAYDTTATTTTWTLKMLTDHQDAQSKLRSEIRLGFSKAKIEKRLPSYQEIIKTAIPHLDAITEEAIRYARTVPSAIRTAMTILGCRIPKGTNVFLSIPGPSIFSPAFPIDESLRSPSAIAAKDVIGSWNPDDMGEFRPERWLVEKDGKMVFDPNAGPTIAFGGGPHGCYGKRLAHLQMSLVLVLTVWNFELRKCPQELSGWAAVDKLLHTPAQCYVRLKKL